MRRDIQRNARSFFAQENSAASSAPGSLAGAARPFWFIFESPKWSGLVALVIYALLTNFHVGLFKLSEWPFYNYLADAFLHGQLALRLLPPDVHDLVFYAGKYYLYWPPFPALLMMPLVALFGVQVSDVAFTAALSGLTVALLAYLLRLLDRRGVIPLTPAQRALLVIFFAFGTVFFTLAVRGRVWFTGQIVGFTAVLLAYIFVLRFQGWKAFLLAGVAMAAAAATRNNLIFAGIWPAAYLLKTHWPARTQEAPDKKKAWRRLAFYSLLGAGPVIATVALLMLYNWARFGSPVNEGLAYHLMAGQFLADYRKYGIFNLHCVPINFYYQYIYYPLPITKESAEGGSLFLLSPLFFAIFWAFGRRAGARIDALVLLGAILLVNIPIITLMGTGWVQLGPRYTLDFTVPLLMLTALGMRRWPRWVVTALLLISVAHYLLFAIIPLPRP